MRYDERKKVITFYTNYMFISLVLIILFTFTHYFSLAFILIVCTLTTTVIYSVVSSKRRYLVCDATDLEFRKGLSDFLSIDYLVKWSIVNKIEVHDKSISIYLNEKRNYKDICIEKLNLNKSALKALSRNCELNNIEFISIKPTL